MLKWFQRVTADLNHQRVSRSIKNLTAAVCLTTVLYYFCANTALSKIRHSGEFLDVMKRTIGFLNIFITTVFQVCSLAINLILLTNG